MQAVKHAAATAKEKANNATTKVEEKISKGKAAGNEKTDKVLASDEVGKKEAEARRQEQKGAAKAETAEKKAEHAQEKQELKHDINTRQAAAGEAAGEAYKNVDTGVPGHTTT